jgi:Mg-chelatase subunit ChlD
MVWECQSKGPRGPELSYFELVLIQFGTSAELVLDAVPVRQIDADTIEVLGNGGGTNITEALELTYQGLVPYMGNLQSHPERAEHPLPLVLLFSDGHNGHGKPEPVADKIKSLSLDGQHVMVVCAGVATEASDEADERLLKSIASHPECYLRIDTAEMLSAFLAEVGSSGVPSPHELAQIVGRIAHACGIED